MHASVGMALSFTTSSTPKMAGRIPRVPPPLQVPTALDVSLVASFFSLLDLESAMKLVLLMSSSKILIILKCVALSAASRSTNNPDKFNPTNVVDTRLDICFKMSLIIELCNIMKENSKQLARLAFTSCLFAKF